MFITSYYQEVIMNDLSLLNRLYKSCNQNKATEAIFGSTGSLKIRVVKNLKVI